MPDNDVQLINTRLDIQMMPENFSRAYKMYNLHQAENLEKLAGKTRAQDSESSALNEKVRVLQNNTVKKDTTATQRIKSRLDTKGVEVNGVKVLGARVGGITPAKGEAHAGDFDTETDYLLTPAEGIRQTRRRIKLLEDALRAHGLIV